MEENKDKYLETLIKNVEEMNNKDKTGLSFVDIMRPHSNLYNYVSFKIGLLTEEEQAKANKALYGK